MNRAGSILSGVLGGLIVLVVGAVLIATDVIDTGDSTREVVRQQPIQSGSAEEGEGRTVSDIYREEGKRRRVHRGARRTARERIALR